jgi:hypothetical protein
VSAVPVVPTGVVALVGDVVVARAGRIRPDTVRGGAVSLQDPQTGTTVVLAVGEVAIVSTVTMGWLFGHEVTVAPGTTTRYLLGGQAWEGPMPPFGVPAIEDDGSFRLATDDLDDLVAVRSVTDVLVVDSADSSVTASAWSTSEGHGDHVRPLASLAPVPVPDGEPRPGVQRADGSVDPLTDGTVRTWVHGLGMVDGREVEILAERGQRVWVASRRPLSHDDRQVNGRYSDGVGSRFVSWVDQAEVTSRSMLRREWSGADGAPLLQGRYARVAGLWRALPTSGLADLGPDGQRLLRPGVTVVGGAFPVPLDDEDHAWTLTTGGRAVPDAEVTDVVSVRTTAQVAGIEVELVRPWDPMTDGDVFLVGGDGVPGEPVLLSDGFTFRPRAALGGGWAARVRRDHLDGVESTVVTHG